MNPYDYYERIKNTYLEDGEVVDEIEERDDKIIIHHTPEIDRKYFVVNINHIKEGVKQLEFKDADYINTSIVAKKNNKVIISSIRKYICKTIKNKFYYKRVEDFISFSSKGITTNMYEKCISKVPYIRSGFHKYDHINKKYNFYLRDLAQKYHPEILWAMDLNETYNIGSYVGVKHFKKHFTCKEDLLDEYLHKPRNDYKFDDDLPF